MTLLIRHDAWVDLLRYKLCYDSKRLEVVRVDDHLVVHAEVLRMIQELEDQRRLFIRINLNLIL